MNINRSVLKPIVPQNFSAEPDDEIDILALVRTLWRERSVIILFAAFTMTAGIYFAYFRTVPHYKATTTVVLEDRQQNMVDLPSGLGNLSQWDDATIQTEIAVLTSRNLVKKVVLDLDLIRNPGFNWTLVAQEPSYFDNLDRLKKTWLEKMGPSTTKEMPGVEISDDQIVESIVSRVQGMISVENPDWSYILEISASSTDPQMTVLLANRIAELYIEDQLEVKFEKTRRATVWLSERVAELQSDVEAAEQDLKDFKSRSDLVSEDGLFALDVQLKDLRERQRALVDAQAATKTQIAKLKGAIKRGALRDQAELAKDATLNRLLDRATAGDILAIGTFEARAQQIVDRLRSDLERDIAQEEAVSAAMARQEVEIKTQSDDLVAVQQKEREAQASRLIYEYFLARLKEMSVNEGIHQSDARILSPAIGPQQSNGPSRSRILALYTMLGVMLGAAFILIREALQNTLRTSDDLEALTGISVMGQIPNVGKRSRSKVIDYLASNPASAASEAVRNLRTSLFLSNLDAPPQVIMLTSSLPGEGKTTTTLAFAQNIAALGKKVLLIEGDIRRQMLGTSLNIKNQSGVLSVLAGTVDLKDAVYHHKEHGFDVLIGGTSSANPADVFSSDRFCEFVRDARKIYDIIIFDAPPVLLVPDARIIGQSVDAVLFVVLWDKTKKHQVRDGISQLTSVGVKITGLVLSNINPKGMKRYGHGDRYGAYSPSMAKRYYRP